MKRKIPKNIHQPGDKIGEWKRIFKILPVRTEDGYRVWCGYVWARDVPTGLDWETLYHTNPEGREEKRNYHRALTEGLTRHGNKMPSVKRPKRPPPPPAPPRRVGGEDMTTEKIVSAWEEYQANCELTTKDVRDRSVARHQDAYADKGTGPR